MYTQSKQLIGMPYHDQLIRQQTAPQLAQSLIRAVMAAASTSASPAALRTGAGLMEPLSRSRSFLFSYLRSSGFSLTPLTSPRWPDLRRETLIMLVYCTDSSYSLETECSTWEWNTTHGLVYTHAMIVKKILRLSWKHPFCDSLISKMKFKN